MTSEFPVTATLPRIALAFAALAGVLLGNTASAQTLDGPVSVCAGEQFNVEWTGPDGDGDLIVISGPQMPADEIFNWSATADGNPASMRAPFETGTYELRYVQKDPLDILVADDLIVERCSSASSEEEQYPQVAVEVRGWQIDHGDQINRSDDTPFGPAGYTIDQLCGASDQIGAALQMMVDQIETGMQEAGSPVTLDSVGRIPGAPTRADIEQDLRNARDAVCDNPPPRTTVQQFVVTYAYCRMAMYTPTHAMDIHLPPGMGDGTMSMADHVKREVATMTLRRNVETYEAVIGKGWGDTITMDGPKRAAIHMGYPTREYDFEYTGGLGSGPAAIPGITNTIRVRNTGKGWFTSQVPGIDIIRLFYDRMSSEVVPDDGAMSFFGSLINNMVGMLRKGIPLVMDQTTSSSVMGRTMVSGRTEHYLTSVRMVDFYPEWCSESLMPPGYEVTDIDAELSEALGTSQPDSGQVAEAMQEYNQAMEQMTPEQRAMMESMGLGDMMQQAMGAATGQAAASGQAGAAPAPPAAGSNMPSSADLMTDDVTQSVQLHLQALGYDPGNTDGDASLETSIAISQFQAEKGLEVTGEVSPVLLGMLAAEVDSRR